MSLKSILMLPTLQTSALDQHFLRVIFRKPTWMINRRWGLLVNAFVLVKWDDPAQVLQLFDLFL